MGKHQNPDVESFAHAYIASDFNGAAAVRALWPDDSNPGATSARIRALDGCMARVDELKREWVRDTCDQVAARLAKVSMLPTEEEGAGRIAAKDLAKVADVAAKYLGVASRVANADGSNLIGPVICELPAQILDPDEVRRVAGAAPVPDMAGETGSPAADSGAVPGPEVEGRGGPA